MFKVLNLGIEEVNVLPPLRVLHEAVAMAEEAAEPPSDLLAWHLVTRTATSQQVSLNHTNILNK
jgi:hypothetical protein